MNENFRKVIPKVYNRLRLKKFDEIETFRDTGFMEAYLVEEGLIDPYAPYNLIDIDNSVTLFGHTFIKSTRKEGYREHILRIAKEHFAKKNYLTLSGICDVQTV